MSMVGELKYFLGLQVAQGEDSTRIHQQKYVKEILKKFGMESAKACATQPMSPNDTLAKDESSPRVDPTLYRGTIGSLLYLTASRPRYLIQRLVYVQGFRLIPGKPDGPKLYESETQ
ncbi:unnamed protein product [Rhodiola kirilowii]